MPQTRESVFEDVMAEAARQLCSVEHLAGGAFVRAPLIYPGGSYVVVRVTQNEAAFVVSDYGLGYQEAELLGATPSYVRLGRIIAENAGVGFDQHAFFVLEVSREQLVGAVATVANCSLEAVILAAHKVAERKAAVDGERLYGRLLGVFPQSKVVKDATYIGESNTDWNVSTLVTPMRGKPTIFETVTAHRNSVSAASTKFTDIKRLPNAPNRVAVVQSKSDMGTLLGVLAQSAQVIEEAAPDDLIRRIAEAA